jgi:hypothetical protein
MSVNFPTASSQASNLAPVCRVCTETDYPRIQLVQGVGENPHLKGVVVERHWPSEGHIKRTENNRTESPRTKKGRPKKWGSEAERLRAYRERSK